MNERTWIDIEPGESSFSAYGDFEESNQSSSTHSNSNNEKTTEQFISGRSRIVFRINCMLGSRRMSKKGYISTVLIFQETIIYFRALQGHSGRSLIDPSLQDNVIIQCGLFHHIYQRGCVF